MFLRKFVSAVFAFTLLGLTVAAQAAVVPVVGAMQGATLFAANNGSLEQGLQPSAGADPMNIHPVLGTPTQPVTNVKSSDDRSNLYAVVGLGLLGLLVARRKRYGRK